MLTMARQSVFRLIVHTIPSAAGLQSSLLYSFRMFSRLRKTILPSAKQPLDANKSSPSTNTPISRVVVSSRKVVVGTRVLLQVPYDMARTVLASVCYAGTVVWNPSDTR